MTSDENVYGTELRPCSTDPKTGFERDGHCRASPRDPGRHEICSVMTEEFLQHSAEQGNDLTTPRPDLQFPGLEPGDHWCVCVPRWLEAYDADCAPPVALDATSRAVLDDVPLQTLEAYAVEE
ncbi:DUF2237 domain-containing protein [Haloarculaceae archaeon H-GB11]|nr:DUF2237 domain-containing protein [Haloarculaceae archaeon H-GB11]